jgi:hypothetical protein
MSYIFVLPNELRTQRQLKPNIDPGGPKFLHPPYYQPAKLSQNLVTFINMKPPVTAKKTFTRVVTV